jgi:hypothetical protein
MKRIYLIAIVLLLCSSSVISIEPNFLVICVSSGDTAVKYSDSYETVMESYLKDAFPCAKITTHSGVGTRLARERLNQLLGDENQQELIKIGKDMNWDYFVKLSLKTFEGKKIMVRAVCLERKNVNCIADAGYTWATMDYQGIKTGMNEMSKQLIDKLSKYEICAFQGPVSITISSDLDSTKVEDYGVYCNGSDERYRKETVIKNHTFSEWKLERKGIPWTDGTMTFYTDEMTKTTEEDGCHKCKSGKREGGLVTTMTSSLKVKGTGISHDSQYQGKKQDDTRVELQFLESGKYLVVAKGTSQAVTGEDKVVTKAEGTCDNQPQETKLLPRDIRVPLRVIFGPYDGKATDKLLQQKDTKEVKDPSTNEKQTITIDFSLTQKDK